MTVFVFAYSRKYLMDRLGQLLGGNGAAECGCGPGTFGPDQTQLLGVIRRRWRQGEQRGRDI